MSGYGPGARRSNRLLLSLGIAALVSACGGDDDPSAAGEATASAVADALPGTPAEVEEALLTVDDLGEGWVDLGALPLDERGFDECPESQVVTAGTDPARRGEAQSLYGQGEPPVPTFGESISLWESPEVAQERFATFASMTSECRSFEHTSPEVGRLTVRMLPGEAPPMGDEAVTVVVEADPPEGPKVLRDTVIVRIGDALVLTEGPDMVEDDPQLSRQRDQLEELTREAVDKATRALSS